MSPRKVLIIRFSSIGDIILTTPVIRALKEQTGAEVHFITKSAFVPVLKDNPHISRLWLIQKEITEVLDELQKERFDFVIDLHHNLRSLRLKKQLGCPSATFPKLNLEKWLMVNLKWNRLPSVHIVDRYFQAVNSLKVKNDQRGLELFLSEKFPEEQFGELLNQPYVAFAIGAQHATKRLPTDRILEICDQLDLPVVLLGGKEDEAAGDIIQSTSKNKKVINACGQCSLQQSFSMVQKAKVVIAHDTGLMHAAAAFQKPVASVWGNTIPEFGMYPYEPGNEDQVLISEVKNLKCRPCSKIGHASCPKGHFDCMNKQDLGLLIGWVKKRF